LKLNGFDVLRFWNNEVLQDCEGVLTKMLQHLRAPPSPQPSPASGRGG
jgi:very-short-patch-repair endonuclease